MTPEEQEQDLAKAPARPGAGSWAKKVVLLVDVDSRSREARARVMRDLGAEVHCAGGAPEARLQLHAGKYHIVLIDFGSDQAGAEKFAGEVRARNPGQLLAFLVGSPRFVVKTLGLPPRQRSAPPQVAAPAVPSAAPKMLDFGQKIRDAEAEQGAEQGTE